jgi:hypothetical protein
MGVPGAEYSLAVQHMVLPGIVRVCPVWHCWKAKNVTNQNERRMRSFAPVEFGRNSDVTVVLPRRETAARNYCDQVGKKTLDYFRRDTFNLHCTKQLRGFFWPALRPESADEIVLERSLRTEFGLLDNFVSRAESSIADAAVERWDHERVEVRRSVRILRRAQRACRSPCCGLRHVAILDLARLAISACEWVLSVALLTLAELDRFLIRRAASSQVTSSADQVSRGHGFRNEAVTSWLTQTEIAKCQSKKTPASSAKNWNSTTN